MCSSFNRGQGLLVHSCVASGRGERSATGGGEVLKHGLSATDHKFSLSSFSRKHARGSDAAPGRIVLGLSGLWEAPVIRVDGHDALTRSQND